MTDSPIISGTAMHREALRWFLRLRAPDCTPGERQAFEQWLGRHPAHAREYESVQMLWDRMDVLNTHPLPEFDDLLRGRASPHSLWNPAALLPFTLAVTAMLVLVIGGAWWWKEMQTTVTPYQTAVGETHTVTLADGTVMEINTRTSLTVSLSSQERRIHLEEGEIYLTVVHEEELPFIVSTKGGRIRDIGTRFSVHSQEDRSVVAVAEDEVQITLQSERPGSIDGRIRHLQAGERIVYTNGEIWSDVERINTCLVAAWRQGKLIFEGIALQEAIQEVKRYWPEQIILAGPELADIKVKGIFDIKNLSGFFLALPQILPVQVTQDRAGRMILSRN